MATLKERISKECRWYSKDQQNKFTQFYSLLKTPVPDDRAAISNLLDQIICLRTSMTYILAVADAELDMSIRQSYLDPSMPNNEHGKKPERQSILDDLT